MLKNKTFLFLLFILVCGLLLVPFFFTKFEKKYKSYQKISVRAYINLLKLLPSTTFPSVYSSVNYLEYFAEYFFTYVHCVEHKLPYEYQIFQNDELMLTLENGIHLSSNQKKKDFVKAILKQEKESK